jgi:hypothetical protein
MVSFKRLTFYQSITKRLPSLLRDERGEECPVPHSVSRCCLKQNCNKTFAGFKFLKGKHFIIPMQRCSPSPSEWAGGEGYKD